MSLPGFTAERLLVKEHKDDLVTPRSGPTTGNGIYSEWRSLVVPSSFHLVFECATMDDGSTGYCWMFCSISTGCHYYGPW